MELTSWDLSMCFFVESISCSFENISLDKVISAIALPTKNPAWFLTYFPTMANGYDYPSDLCVQNAFWRRLDTVEILQIRLEESEINIIDMNKVYVISCIFESPCFNVFNFQYENSFYETNIIITNSIILYPVMQVSDSLSAFDPKPSELVAPPGVNTAEVFNVS